MLRTFGSFGFFEDIPKAQSTEVVVSEPRRVGDLLPAALSVSDSLSASISVANPPQSFEQSVNHKGRGINFRKVTIASPSSDSSEKSSSHGHDAVSDKDVAVANLPIPLKMRTIANATYNSKSNVPEAIMRIVPNVPQFAEDDFLLDFFKRSRKEKDAILCIQSWWRMVVERQRYHEILDLKRRVRNAWHRKIFRSWWKVVLATRLKKFIVRRRIFRHWKRYLDNLKSRYGAVSDDQDVKRITKQEEIVEWMADDCIRRTFPEENRNRAFRHSDKLVK